MSAAAFFVLINLINLANVKVFGEAEFWFAIIKVVAIVGMIALGSYLLVSGTGGPQAGDIVGAVTQFAEYHISVLAQSGDCPHVQLEAADHRRRQQRLDGAVRCADLAPPIAGLEVRMRDDLTGQVVPRIADTGGVGDPLDIVEFALCAPGSDGGVKLVAVHAAI